MRESRVDHMAIHPRLRVCAQQAVPVERKRVPATQMLSQQHVMSFASVM
jgi:hypothetical protein